MGRLPITERQFDRRSGRIITLMKIGSLGTSERYSKVLVGTELSFRRFGNSRNVEVPSHITHSPPITSRLHIESPFEETQVP